MSSNAASPLGLPSDEEIGTLMRVFENDLAVLEGEFGQNVATVTDIYLLIARVHIRSYHWLRSTSSEDKRSGLLRSYTAASSLITGCLAYDDASGILAYSPNILQRVIFHAAYIVFKTFNSSLRQFINLDDAATLIQKAQALLHRVSAAPNDLPIRASNILADIWKHRDDDLSERLRDPELSFPSHLTLSLTYDAAWRWQMQRARLTGDSINNNGSTTARNGSHDPPSLPQELATPATFNWDLFDDLDWNLACDDAVL
ncbi:MAG: hypothetical protein M1818_001184 [Claussenomyces sp. TS43310]|nr:MAG: hypothetical protein M1818_001184 [Claussenomyces sp. TS43310]